jgi:DNA phosphorothioation-dependent restriction protein DptH
MTLSLTLQPIAPSALDELVADECLPVLQDALSQAGTFHRLRVTDLPSRVIHRLCTDLQDNDRWVVRSLTNDQSVHPYEASATKLIELRNSEERPLLVFLPTGLRTAAEDSLDIATFQQIQLNAIPEKVVASLIAKLPESIRKSVIEALKLLRERRVIRDEDTVARYLLTVLNNGGTPKAAGGALFVLGLVPDFGLFSHSAQLVQWLTRNEKAVSTLQELRHPLQERISQLRLQPGSIQPRLFSYLRDRMVGIESMWMADIALKPSWYDLSFDQWPFEDSGNTDEVRIVLDSLALPKQAPDRFSETISLPVLDLDSNTTLKVSFRSIPGPSDVEAWKTYRLQVLSPTDDVPTLLWESNSLQKPKKNAKVNRTIKASDLRNVLAEGTYFLRVEAYGADGAVLTKQMNIDPSQATGRKENESENFLVVFGSTVVDPPDEPRAAFVNSLMDCYFGLRGKALLTQSKTKEESPKLELLTGEWDTPSSGATRSEVFFELSTTGAAGRTVRMPGLLRKIELTILENPQNLRGYHLNLRNARTVADIAVENRSRDNQVDLTGFDKFLVAREVAFQSINQQHQKRRLDSKPEMCVGIVEICDLLAIEKEIFAYAEAFLQLSAVVLQEPDSRSRAARLELLAHLDTIELRWHSNASDPGKGLIIGPTHPLRLLWHLQHARYRESTIEAVLQRTQEVLDPVYLLQTLENSILPTNLPSVMFDHRGRPYIEQDLLTPFWTLLLPADQNGHRSDISLIRMQVRTFLGIRRTAMRLGEVEPKILAERIFDYLQRHPYVEQLRINVFNPGDGERIAQMLRELEKLRQGLPKGLRQYQPELRYAVHLLTSPEHINRSGEALDALLDPERHVAEDDEFTIGSFSHLQPKLLISRSTLEEFLRRPFDFTAHVSILLEQFRVDGRLGETSRFDRGSFVHGLVNEAETQLETSGGSSYGWIRGLRADMPDLSDVCDRLLVETIRLSQRLQAAVAGGDGMSSSPVIALRLDSIDQGLIRAIHDISDQVLTIDRNLGLDYFDSASTKLDTGYLLDFSPGFIRGDGERLLLTTRCTEELIALVQPAIRVAGLELSVGQEQFVLETLRSISGKLALRLFSGLNATREVLGLLLARLLLEQAELLDDRIIIPIDAHQEWFAETDTNISRSRADLLVVALDALTRTIDITVVEVKLRSTLATSDRVQLYAEMREQSDNTVQRLRRLFDPDFLSHPRADFLIRCKEFFSLLSFYIGRSLRYGLLSQDEVIRAQPFISSLEQGYHLNFRTRGIVYTQETSGHHVDEDEIGFPVHRFGPDTAALLLNSSSANLTSPEVDISSIDSGSDLPSIFTNTLSDAEVESLRSFFDAPKRDRSQNSVNTFDSLENLTGLEEDVSPPVTSKTTSDETFFELSTDSPVESIAAEIPTVVPVAEEESITEIVSQVEVLPPDLEAETSIFRPDILLGSTEMTPQYGLLGRFANARIAVDLTGCNTISLFGVQGFGKSYTLGVIAEMGAQSMPGINTLMTPLATVIFHYHKSDTYEPEFLAAIAPNNKTREVQRLQSEYQAQPAGLRDLILLVPEAKLEQRRQEHPSIEVQPIKFSSAELGADSWKFLLGAFGNDSLYVRQLVAIMRRYRDRLTLGRLRQEIEEAELSPATRRLAEDRIGLAEPYIDDQANLRNLLKPGRTIIVDLRDEWLEKEDALGLFVVIMKTFSQAKYMGKDFNKLMVFDEAHKYITESELIGQVVEIIREMRHQATSVVIASQDPLSVPRSVIELTSLLVLHRMTSPQWLKHLKGAISALDNVTENQVSALVPGEALVWAQRSTDPRFTQRPQKIQIRPRVTRHGGGTKTAVEGATLR